MSIYLVCTGEPSALEENSITCRVVSSGRNTKPHICVGFAGDCAVETNQGLHLVYISAGTNPFQLINQSVK